MTHTAPRWCGHAGDKRRNRFFAIFPDPFGRFFFCRATDLADQNHRIRVRVLIEKFHRIKMREAVDGVAADADAR